MCPLMFVRKASYADMKKFSPVFTVAGTLLGVADLIEEGTSSSLQSLFLPSIILIYGPALLTNSINHKFEATPQGFLLFIISILLSLITHSNKFFMFLARELANLSKCLSSAELIHSPDDTVEIIKNQIIGALAGMIVKKLITKQKLRIRSKEIIGIIFFNSGIFLIRKYNLPNLSVIVLVYGVTAGTELAKLFKHLFNMKEPSKGADKGEEQSEALLSSSSVRQHRRRASVATLLEKKGKEL